MLHCCGCLSCRGCGGMLHSKVLPAHTMIGKLHELLLTGLRCLPSHAVPVCWPPGPTCSTRASRSTSSCLLAGDMKSADAAARNCTAGGTTQCSYLAATQRHASAVASSSSGCMHSTDKQRSRQEMPKYSTSLDNCNCVAARVMLSTTDARSAAVIS